MELEEKNNLCFKWLKYSFNTEEIPIFRVVVGQGEVQIEDKNVKATKKWKISTKIKEVKSFLRFANFYRCFIKNFSYIEKSLNKFKDEKKWK